MKVAICDDMKPVGNILEEMVMEYAKINHKKIGTEVFGSGQELIDYMASGYEPDLLFLDIEMPEMDGVEVGKQIRNDIGLKQMKLVYVSGYDGYDRMLFQNQPMNFMKKPCTRESVFNNLKLAEELLGVGDAIFHFRSNNIDKNIKIKDIMYFESVGRKMHIVLKNQIEEFYGTLKDIEEQLKKYDFIRINKSFMVNYHQAQAFTKKEVVMNNGQHILIGRAYKTEVNHRLMDLAIKY